jgi:hypothetical protein
MTGAAEQAVRLSDPADRPPEAKLLEPGATVLELGATVLEPVAAASA